MLLDFGKFSHDSSAHAHYGSKDEWSSKDPNEFTKGFEEQDVAKVKQKQMTIGFDFFKNNQ